ncbi:hypothetical protein ACYOEI_17555, partial [Singulisphaera rosea]
MRGLSHATVVALIVGAWGASVFGWEEIAKPPGFIKDVDDLQGRIAKALRSTKPDFVVFVPTVERDKVADTGNEHFLVFDGPDGSLMAVWTQSSVENSSAALPPDQHIA